MEEILPQSRAGKDSFFKNPDKDIISFFFPTFL